MIGPAYPYRGGIAYFNTLLCQQLSARHEVLLCSFKKQYPRILFGGRSDRDPSEYAPRIACDYVLSALDPLSWLRCFSMIKRAAPDAILFHWWVPFWAPAFGSLAWLIRHSLNVPVLLLCHNVLPHDPFPLAETLTRFVFRGAHAFIVQSERDLQDLRRLRPNSLVTKTHHPTYAPLAASRWPRSKAREQLGLTGPVLLYFGFVRPYKGVEYLLKAIPLVQRAMSVHLLIVGEFWDDKSRYLRLIQELGLESVVTVVDRYVPIEELGLYFDAADVIVLPYVDATQSGVIQLAYGFGKPVISTNVGGLAEVVRDGETGFLVKPRDANALAEGIVRFFNTHDVDWAANVERVQEHFAWKYMVEAIEELILQIRS